MGSKVPTYREVQHAVRCDHGFLPKTCWIADVKESMGLPMRSAPNRLGRQRVNPCPEEKREAIERAIRRLMNS